MDKNQPTIIIEKLPRVASASDFYCPHCLAFDRAHNRYRVQVGKHVDTCLDCAVTMAIALGQAETPETVVEGVMGKQGAVVLPPFVVQALLEIRASGEVDMLDFDSIVEHAAHMGHDDARDWLMAHEFDYLDVLIEFGKVKR